MKGVVGAIHHSAESVGDAVQSGWQLSEGGLQHFDQHAFNDSCAIDKARWSTWCAGDFRPSYHYRDVTGTALSEAGLADGYGVEIPPQDLVLDIWLDIPKATATLNDPLLLWEEWKQVNR